LIIPMIIQRIRRDPAGADQTDAEHQATDLAVEACILLRGARERQDGRGGRAGPSRAPRPPGCSLANRWDEPDRLPARSLVERSGPPGPDRAVRRLIEQLDRYAAATGEAVTVVFDRQPPGVPPGAHGAVVVAFASRRGRDAADHEIVRMLAEDPAPGSVRVVTSDRRLVEQARQLGAEVRSSGRFRHRLEEVLGGAPMEGP
jgi:YacP-like NYN domain-containing protein